MASLPPYSARGLLGSRAPGLAAVLLLHLLLGWAFVSGLAHKVVEVVKAPLETKIIEEIRKPPPELPPPPPPKLAPPPPPYIPPPEIEIQQPAAAPAPAITAVTTQPPPQPVYRAPPAPPPPARPAVRHEYKPISRVEPVFPHRAIKEGLSGEVTAWVYVASDGSVARVEIRHTSNRIFDGEVVRALAQWRFKPEPEPWIGEYEIGFRLKD